MAHSVTLTCFCHSEHGRSDTSYGGVRDAARLVLQHRGRTELRGAAASGPELHPLHRGLPANSRWVLKEQASVQPCVLLLKLPRVSCPSWFQWSGSESASPERAWSSCFDPPVAFQNWMYFTSKADWTGCFCFRFTFIPQRARLHQTRPQRRCFSSGLLLTHTRWTGRNY